MTGTVNFSQLIRSLPADADRQYELQRLLDKKKGRAVLCQNIINELSQLKMTPNQGSNLGDQINSFKQGKSGSVELVQKMTALVAGLLRKTSPALTPTSDSDTSPSPQPEPSLVLELESNGNNPFGLTPELLAFTREQVKVKFEDFPHTYSEALRPELTNKSMLWRAEIPAIVQLIAKTCSDLSKAEAMLPSLAPQLAALDKEESALQELEDGLSRMMKDLGQKREEIDVLKARRDAASRIVDTKKAELGQIRGRIGRLGQQTSTDESSWGAWLYTKIIEGVGTRVVSGVNTMITTVNNRQSMITLPEVPNIHQGSLASLVNEIDKKQAEIDAASTEQAARQAGLATAKNEEYTQNLMYQTEFAKYQETKEDLAKKRGLIEKLPKIVEELKSKLAKLDQHKEQLEKNLKTLEELESTLAKRPSTR